MQVIKGKSTDWQLVIGLEVHAQVSCKAKLFSSAPTSFGAPPNSQVSFVDAGMPGMLPLVNSECIKQAVRTGIALNAQINKYSVFDRKHYFYPDLPSGYQISQFYYPIVGNGNIILQMDDGSTRKIGITRIHLEQDAGKSIHDQSPTETYIDLNRAGVPLMEIVTEPDIRSAEEAASIVKKLRSIMRHIGSCGGNMEKGELRCDVNVSVHPVGSDKYGTRCEIKNLNSVKHIIKAIEYESNRQVEALESGEKLFQETRLFDVNTGITSSLRSKEYSHDYRYMPDPDLLPIELTDDYINDLKATIGELPDEKADRYITNFELTPYDASVLVMERENSDFYDAVVANGANPKKAANWITVEFFSRLNKADIGIYDSKITPENLALLLKMIDDEVISGKIAKQVFEEMFNNGANPKSIVESKGLVQITDEGEIHKIVQEVLSENSSKVEEYRSGKDKLFGFFVGSVMKKTGGKANPKLVNDILQKELENA